MPALSPQQITPFAPPARRRDVETRELPDQMRLDWLRQMAARCRAMPRDDLFRACAMLGGDGAKHARDTVAVALLRTLPRVVLAGKLQFYQPGARERSFDEAWLMSALAAAEREDTDSLAFLLARRVPGHARRHVGFLVGALSRALDNPA